jgi:copper(I)-binding protein
MKKHLCVLLFAALLLTACGAGEKEIEVHNAWVRPTASGSNAAVYFIIHNHTDQDDELTGASATVAGAVEIHEGKMENDVMQMSMVASVPLAADEEITFKPGGLHIMLVNINQELVLGGHIGLTLHFKNHEDVVVNVHIENTVPEDEHEDDH